MIKRILIIMAVMVPALCRAQLSGQVAVEGEYAPLVIETSRLNAFPAPFRFELPDVSLAYRQEGIVADYAPSLMTMGVTGWHVQRSQWPARGFVDLRLGSWLDSRLDAGYRVVADSLSSLDARLKFNSSSLYRMHGVPDSYTRPARRRYYDGRLMLDYRRLLGSEGLLEAGISYRLGYFNYYGSTAPVATAGDDPKVPTQTLNQLHAGASYRSTPSLLYGWHAGASVDWLGYRRFYYPGFATGVAARGDREAQLNVEGGYVFGLGESNAIAVDAAADFLFYPGKDDENPNEYVSSGRNYGIVTLTPAYRYGGGPVSLQAGVDLGYAYDVTVGNGERKGMFRIAPDVKIAYRQGQFGLSLSATGGTTPLTLALKEQYDLYQLPVVVSTRPLYSPLDAALKLSFGPFAGFAADLGVRYAIVRNTPTGGWYQTVLGSWPQPEWGTSVQGAPLYDLSYMGLDLAGIGVDLNLRYKFGKIFEAEFNGSYVPQSGKRGIFNGYDRPRWVLDTKASVRPFDPLSIELGYRYRGVRKCYTYMVDADGAMPLASVRLGDITDLHARVGYHILPRLEVYCQGENLLNRRVELLPGLQSEGIAILGGFNFLF